jgi:hypothetical protein
VISQTPPPYRAWIYRLGLDLGNASVNQQRRALVFVVPRRLEVLRLFSPGVRLDDGAPPGAGVPFRVATGGEGPHLWIESTVGRQTRRAEVILTPTMVWGAVVPFAYAFGPEAKILTMMWVGIFMVPLGYWGSLSERPLAALIVIALAVASGFGLMPHLGGMGSIPWREWVAAAAGVGAGWAARPSAPYLGSRCGSPSVNESSSS